MKILAIDPSGEFTKGKGTTGFCLYDVEKGSFELFEIKANDYESRASYFYGICMTATTKGVKTIIVEDYFLYNNAKISANSQTNSLLETPRLLGALEYEAHNTYTDIVFQRANIKTRFTDEILVKMGLLEKRGNKYYANGKPTNDHQRDALRHALYYVKFGKKEN